MSAKIALTKAQTATVQKALQAVAKPVPLAAKKSPAKKPTTKKSPAKKPATKKSTAKKPAAKKSGKK